MKRYLYIGIGGFLGAILRYALEAIPVYNYQENIPLNTLIINVTGSFVLALVFTVAFEVWEFDSDVRLGIGTGFIGAYTTFSTLCKETVALLHRGLYFSAISYITISTVLGLAAVYFGVILAREAISKMLEDKPVTEEEPD